MDAYEHFFLNFPQNKYQVKLWTFIIGCLFSNNILILKDDPAILVEIILDGLTNSG